MAMGESGGGGTRSKFGRTLNMYIMLLFIGVICMAVTLTKEYKMSKDSDTADSTIKFFATDEPDQALLEIRTNGDFLVKDKLVKNDMEVYEAMKAWLKGHLPASAKPPEVLLTDNEDGDWEGIYVNGECKAQGHSISVPDALDALGISYDRKEYSSYEMDEMGAQFPDKEEDLP